jgi:hypothetical protein
VHAIGAFFPIFCDAGTRRDALLAGKLGAVGRSKSPHRNRRADFKSHQVFTNHKRPIIGLSGLGDDLVDRGRRNFCVTELKNVGMPVMD